MAVNYRTYEVAHESCKLYFPKGIILKSDSYILKIFWLSMSEEVGDAMYC